MKKERRRLVLSGTDDAYAKREAAQTLHVAKAPSSAIPAASASAPERKKPAFKPPGPSQEPATASTAKPEPQAQTTGKSIQVNFRLNLGADLSTRLHRVVDAHDQPIELVMKGIRNRAAERFMTLASSDTKPAIPSPASGGLSIRYAATFSGDQARNLTRWFDPFGLGVAKEACKPILIQLFQEEAKALCEAADRWTARHG